MARISHMLPTCFFTTPMTRSVQRLSALLCSLLFIALIGCAQDTGDGTRSCFDTSDCLANQTCTEQVCGCAEGYSDCDGDPTNGCEFEGQCLCPQLGLTEACYDGPADTQGVGACAGGEKTCTATGWSDYRRRPP